MATLLPDFVSLGLRMSLYTPTEAVPEQLIIICGWLGAAPKHIVKYITVYQSLAPEARILLIESDIRIITSRYDKQRELIKPAVSVVLDTLANFKPLSDTLLDGNASSKTLSSRSSSMIEKPPRILLHMFSNGGTNSATQLLLALHKHLRRPLPVIGLLFDSCPSLGTYWKSHAAMALSLRPTNAMSRFLSAIVAHCILIILYTWIACGNDNPATLMRRTLLDEDMLVKLNVDDGQEVSMRACFLFSEADRQVDWAEIKGYVEETKKKGWKVEEVVFKGSAHCAHFLKDSKRYEEAMKGMWLGHSE